LFTLNVLYKFHTYLITPLPLIFIFFVIFYTILHMNSTPDAFTPVMH